MKEKGFLDEHSPLAIWLALVSMSIIVSGVIMGAETSVTGMFSFDTGPDVELNPDFIDKEEYDSNMSSAVLILTLLVIFQVAAYFVVTWELEAKEKMDEMEF